MYFFARNKSTCHRDAGMHHLFFLCFISEGALPFVAADQFSIIISSLLGGAGLVAVSM